MNAPQFEICEEKNLEDCLTMVLDGKADFAAQNVRVLTPYLANPYYEELTAVPTFFMEENTGIVGLDSEEHRMLIKILNKCIGMISEKEIAQFKVDHTLATAYEPTLSDMVYKFRYPIAVIGILLLQIVAWMVAFELLRRRNYHKLEEKNEQLAVAVAQANSANEAKGQFLARMSHEIRTPINAIVGLTEIARHRSDEGGGVEECLDKIDTSSKVLLAIVNDVLDMSAIESNRIKIAQAPFSLKEVLDSISAVYGTQCEQKKIAFTVEMDEVQVEQVQGDVLRLNQVLLNLISNAYKFTPEGGSIRVTVSELPMQQEQFFYKFVVTDTGEGMSEEMQERLFLPFEQEEAETAQHHGGSGLGLSIAKNLVELMGGSISCQSKKGVGTTFTVSLPLAHAVDEKKQKAEETGEGEAEEDRHQRHGYIHALHHLCCLILIPCGRRVRVHHQLRAQVLAQTCQNRDQPCQIRNKASVKRLCCQIDSEEGVHTLNNFIIFMNDVCRIRECACQIAPLAWGHLVKDVHHLVAKRRSGHSGQITDGIHTL